MRNRYRVRRPPGTRGRQAPLRAAEASCRQERHDRARRPRRPCAARRSVRGTARRAGGASSPRAASGVLPHDPDPRCEPDAHTREALLGEPRPRGEDSLHLRGGILQCVLVEWVEARPVAVAVAAMQEQGALGDPADPELRERRGPLVQSGGVTVRLVLQVVVPACGVVERVRRREGERPGVAAGAGDPGGAGVRRRRPGCPRPSSRAASRSRRPRGARRRRRRRSPRARRRRRAPSRKTNRDSGETTNGGIARDQVERLALHRAEEASAPDLDVVEPFIAALNAANASARSFTSVATTRSRAGPRERLDAAAGADVEGAANAAARREERARARRRRVGRDVVGRILAARVGVGGEEDALDRRDPPERHDRAREARARPVAARASASPAGASPRASRRRGSTRGRRPRAACAADAARAPGSVAAGRRRRLRPASPRRPPPSSRRRRARPRASPRPRRSVAAATSPARAR